VRVPMGLLPLTVILPIHGVAGAQHPPEQKRRRECLVGACEGGVCELFAYGRVWLYRGKLNYSMAFTIF
jgi:hypothetical protein